MRPAREPTRKMRVPHQLTVRFSASINSFEDHDLAAEIKRENKVLKESIPDIHLIRFLVVPGVGKPERRRH